LRNVPLLVLLLCASCVVAPRHPASRSPVHGGAESAAGIARDESQAGSVGAELRAFEHEKFKSKAISAGIIAGAYTSLYAWTYFAWYRNRQTTSFQILDEGLFEPDTYAGGADKLGHFYANYVFTRATSQMLERGGWSRRASRWTASGLTATFFGVIETKDGLHEGFGFSLSDLGANLLGLGLGMVMESYPSIDRALSLRLEYVPTSEYVHQLIRDGVVNAAEDYSGQTTYLAYHLASSLPEELPRWIDWLRYVDVVAGAGSRNYLPALADSQEPYRQELRFGVSVNVQKLLSPWLSAEHDSWRGSRSTGRFLSEVVQLPFTSLSVLTLAREYDGPLQKR
jgi:hypothetical protein